MSIAPFFLLTYSIVALPPDEPTVVATVDGHEITTNRVERFIKTRLGSTPLSNEAKKIAFKESLEHLVNRHIVLIKISENSKVGSSLIALEVSKLTDRLAEIDKSLSDYLKENETTQSDLEYEFRWRLAWRKYLKKQLTDERLITYFNKYHRKFDQTKMRVAHILFEKSNDRAAEVKKEIEQGKINWNEASQRYSIAKTSSSRGGEIGWIQYDGPMVPSFGRAASALEVGEISEPVKTKFGIHLIKCLEIEEGKVDFGDVKAEVREDATKFLFDSIANKNRSKSKIQVSWN